MPITTAADYILNFFFIFSSVRMAVGRSVIFDYNINMFAVYTIITNTGERLAVSHGIQDFLTVMPKRYSGCTFMII